MLTRRQSLGFASLALAPGFGGCGRKHSGQIAVIPKTTAIDYWENLHAGASKAASRLGLRVFWNGPQLEANFVGQALLVEDVIRQRVDGIVLAPSHGSVLASAVRHANAEGIPLVLVDSPVMATEQDYLAYIGSDPATIGEMAARRIGSVLQGRGRVAVIGVSPTVEPAVIREHAFAATMRREFPAIQLADPLYGLSDVVRSREIAAETLRSESRTDALFASDQFATRGALIALSSSRPHRSVRLVGVAQERDLLDFLSRGEIDALLIQDSYRMGVTSVEILGQALRSAYRGPRRIVTQVELVTREQVSTPRVQALITPRTV